MVQPTGNTSTNTYSLEQSKSSCLYPQGDPFIDKPFEQPACSSCHDTNDSPMSSAEIQEQNDQNLQNDQNNFTTKLPDLSRLKTKLKKKTIPFWATDPNILLNQTYMTEFFPIDGMTFYQKLNAITRLVIVMTVISFLYTNSTRILAIGSLSILAIFLLYFAYKKEKNNQEGLGAGYMTPDPSLPPPGPVDPFKQILSKEQEFSMTPEQFSQTFDKPTPDNPLSNVLVPDYHYDVNKKPAPPSFTQKGSENVLENAKKMVVEQNPGQPDIADKLFGDLGDELTFEQSLQRFYSNANTTIPNDQGAFAQFCYGNMISAKEGNMLALGRNNPRWIDGSN